MPAGQSVGSGYGAYASTLPVAVLASFIPRYYLGVSSNIMSLGGLALAIGELVDASIVMPGDAPYASPAIRAFARELGVDIQQVKGSGRGGRFLELGNGGKRQGSRLL